MIDADDDTDDVEPLMSNRKEYSFDGDDVEFMLSMCDPDMPRADWLGVSSFMKNRCRGLKIDAYKVWVSGASRPCNRRTRTRRQNSKRNGTALVKWI